MSPRWQHHDLLGRVFGFLTVLKDLGIAHRHAWLTACRCGKTYEARQDHLLNGKVRSCGCLKTSDAKALARIEECSELEPNTGCQLWTGYGTEAGYGRISYRGHVEFAHRVHYEIVVGPIPKGLQLDHLCRVTACVNPQHLEPVTPRENTLRSNSPSAKSARATHCAQGHPFSGENLFIAVSGQRVCRICRRNCRRASDVKRRAHV